MRIDAGNTDGKWESQDVRALAYDFSGIVGRTVSVDDRRVIALARTLLNRGSMEWSWSVIGGNGLDFSTLNQIRFIHMVMERLGLGHDARWRQDVHQTGFASQEDMMKDVTRQSLKPMKYLFRLLHGNRWALLLVLLVMGCSSDPPHYEGAFSASQQVKGNSESISAPMDMAWGAVLEVLSQQGFLIQQADSKSHIILANREMRSKEDKDLSHTVAATITLLPSSDQMTRVMVAANQTTELHKKSYTWWHLLWLIPIFPTGTEYTTVVVERDTVRSPQFYSDFFGAVKKSTEEKKGPAQSAPAS